MNSPESLEDTARKLLTTNIPKSPKFLNALSDDYGIGNYMYWYGEAPHSKKSCMIIGRYTLGIESGEIELNGAAIQVDGQSMVVDLSPDTEDEEGDMFSETLREELAQFGNNQGRLLFYRDGLPVDLLYEVPWLIAAIQTKDTEEELV